MSPNPANAETVVKPNQRIKIASLVQLRLHSGAWSAVYNSGVKTPTFVNYALPESKTLS
jgi:hypothetical protein